MHWDLETCPFSLLSVPLRLLHVTPIEGSLNTTGLESLEDSLQEVAVGEQKPEVGRGDILGRC